MTRHAATADVDPAAPEESTDDAENASDADLPAVGDDRSAGESASDDPAVLYRTMPTVKPSLVWLALTLFAGGAFALASFANVFGFEDETVPTILGWAVVFVAFVVVVRLLVHVYVLTRTTYTLTASGVRYEFSLWFRHRAREVPFEMVRGHELTQDRIQRLFGVGTVAVLTGGVDASLGHVEFSNVPDPKRVERIVRERRGDGAESDAGADEA